MRKIAILAGVALMALMLAPALAAAGPKEIKIGVIYPLTGPAAAAGRELRAGAELAAQIANEVMPKIKMTMAQNAGVKSLGGAKIKLIFKDHQGNPQLGADLAKKLILDDKVVGILGCYYSSVTKTVSSVCERYGVPMINGSSTSPTLTKRGLKWFWRTTPHDKWFTKDLFEFLIGLTKGKVKGVPAVPMADIKALAAACEKTEWGANVSIEIANFAKEYGFDLKANILYAAKSPDLSSEVQSMIATKPGAMLFASYTSDALLLIKTLKSMKAKPKVIWGQDAGFDKPEFVALGQDVVGVLTRSVFLPSVVKMKPLAGEVNDLYMKKMGHNLDGASARAFTGLQTWVYVLEKAGSTEPKAIQAACNTISIPGEQLVVPWVGIKFSTKGEEIGQNVLGGGLIGQYQMKDGKVGLEVVYPFDIATAPMIYPFQGY